MGASTTGKQTVRIHDTLLTITHLHKPLWPEPLITKATYLNYLTEIAPYLLPYLQNRRLTLIRYPDGITGESFYQKHLPQYAPTFFPNQKYILCQDLPSLIWLGNQGAIEFHSPFHTVSSNKPSEIVFDLDPPHTAAFPLAVQAAQDLHTLFQRLQLTSFVKTSGRKGLQVYLPLPEDTFTYKETRRFTTFVAQYLTDQRPRDYTTERFKQNRHGKLYLDIVQHASGKTIIAPYSPRAIDGARVACPLFWEEVDDHLSPEAYTIDSIIDRLNDRGDPFATFHEAQAKQPFASINRYLATLKRD